MPETCPHCTVWDGHAKDCPVLAAGRNGAVDELTPKINEAVTWDDRKDLSSIWQDYAPLPAQGLTESTYDALMAIARWGARRALENER